MFTSVIRYTVFNSPSKFILPYITQISKIAAYLPRKPLTRNIKEYGWHHNHPDGYPTDINVSHAPAGKACRKAAWLASFKLELISLGDVTC